MLALFGSASVVPPACVDGNDGAQPSSSAGSLGNSDSDPTEAARETTSSGSSGGTTASPNNTTASSASDTLETDAENPGSASDPSGGPDPTTTGTGRDRGTSSGGSSTGPYGTTGYASSGYYGSTGYFNADPEDDGWYTGLGSVECGDIPLPNCPPPRAAHRPD